MFLLPHSVGGYTLHRKLGTGGVAESYLGSHDGGGKDVVVRRILPFVLRDPARLASIEARIRDLLGVRHPFLVHVIDYVTEGEDHFVVEEYVQGATLEQVLTWCRQTGHTLPHNVFLNIATQICNGLEALHGRGGKASGAEHVLHLSLKPGSIFLSAEGKVLVGGYGLTRSPTTHPQGGVAGPVPARMEYLSPEQTHPDQKLTPASDVFSLGALLYEVLTLESLFRAESNLQTIHRVRRAEVTTPLLSVRERLPGLDKVLFRALSLNPRHRYQRAFVLREDLRGLMAGYSFATIGEDTRTFLQPLLEAGPGRASPSTGGGSAVGLDHAPDSPVGADSFAEFPTTRIDADPIASAALAASALAERVARERAQEIPAERTERTERTELTSEADLTPLPAAPQPSVRVLVDESSPFLPRADIDDIDDPANPENTAAFLAALDPVSAESLPPPPRSRKRKGRSEPEVSLVPEVSVAPPVPPPPTLAPQGSDAPLPAMAAPPRPAPAPTLAPAPAPTPPSVSPPPQRSYPPPQAAPWSPPEPDPYDPLNEEQPPPSRLPVFAGVAALAGAGVLLCAGMAYWGFSSDRAGTPAPIATDVVAPPAPTEVPPSAPFVAPSEDPAAVLAAMNPEPAAEAQPDPAAEAGRLAEQAAAAAAEAQARTEAAEASRLAKLSDEAARREERSRAAAEAKAASAEKAGASAEAKAEAAERARVAAKTKTEGRAAATAQAEAKAEAAAAAREAADEKARAKADAKAAAAAKAAAKAAPAVDAGLTVVEPPPSTNLDGFVSAARAGKLDSDAVTSLSAVATTDPSYTRSRALLLVDAQKRSDDTAVKKFLDELMVLSENQYNPVFLTDYARWHANHGEYERAVEKASRAERHWARLPSDLVFSKKAEIYEIQAAATQGRFYKSKDDLELLARAVAAWEKYRAHVATRDRTDLAKRADDELAKLADIEGRLQ